MRKRICFAAALLCIFVAGVSYADTGSLQLSLRDVITGYAVSGTVTFNGPQQLTVPTDENGNLLVTLQTGDYIIQASAQGYEPLTTHYGITSGANMPGTIMLDSTSLPEEEQPQQIERQLRPGFTLLQGYVVDVSGKPVSGVRVELVKAGVAVETNSRGYYALSAVTPREPKRGVMGADTLIYERAGYDRVIVENFGISGRDMQGAPLVLMRGNSVIRRDASHKLSGQSLHEPQSPTPTSKLPDSIYKQLVVPGKRFSVAGASCGHLTAISLVRCALESSSKRTTSQHRHV